MGHAGCQGAKVAPTAEPSREAMGGVGPQPTGGANRDDRRAGTEIPRMGAGWIAHTLHSYDVTWDEVAGQLDAVSVSFQDINNNAFVGLTGGMIGSDGQIGTCSAGQCQITGFWAPEPGSATLLSALFGFGLVRRRRRLLLQNN